MKRRAPQQRISVAGADYDLADGVGFYIVD